MYCDFLRPGKHQYLVTYARKVFDTDPFAEERLDLERLKQLQKAKFSADESPIKLEEIPPHIPTSITIRTLTYHQIISEAYAGEYHHKTKAEHMNRERFFSKEKSVFKDWRLDKLDKLQEGFLHETQFWKVPNLIKDTEQVAQITNFMKSEIEFLKTAFIIRSSQSHFPVIKTLSFNHMIQNCQIYEQQFESTTVDRIFIAVTKNTDPELRGKIPDKDMSRMHFYEAIVRVAYYKFKHAQTTPLEAVKKFI